MYKQKGTNIYTNIRLEWKKSKLIFNPYVDVVGVEKWLL